MPDASGVTGTSSAEGKGRQKSWLPANLLLLTLFLAEPAHPSG
jgi:hypothetical protein